MTWAAGEQWMSLRPTPQRDDSEYALREARFPPLFESLHVPSWDHAPVEIAIATDEPSGVGRQ